MFGFLGVTKWLYWQEKKKENGRKKPRSSIKSFRKIFQVKYLKTHKMLHFRSQDSRNSVYIIFTYVIPAECKEGLSGGKLQSTVHADRQWNHQKIGGEYYRKQGCESSGKVLTEDDCW